MLAVWAHRSSGEEGRIAWLRANGPSEAAWESFFVSKGFRRIEDPGWKEKAYAQMPEASRKKDSALLSEDRRTAALRLPTEWVFYQLGGIAGGRPPGTVVARELWEGLGIGWEAIAALDRTELPLVRTESGPKSGKAEWSDPRSIRY
jgi:hypothetical protein